MSIFSCPSHLNGDSHQITLHIDHLTITHSCSFITTVKSAGKKKKEIKHTVIKIGTFSQNNVRLNCFDLRLPFLFKNGLFLF